MSRPNVLWIVLDACRPGNLSCYGYERPTSPVIDSIAERGVVFEQNFAQYTFTTASVPSYMAGRFFPAACIWSGDWQDQLRVPDANEQLIPQIMNENGYDSFLVVSSPWFRAGTRLLESFDRVENIIPPDPKYPYASFDTLNGVILPWLAQPRTKPFFLHVHALDTHFPHYLSPPYDQWLPATDGSDGTEALSADEIYKLQIGWRRDASMPPFTDKEKAYLRGLHDGGIRFADEHIGTLLARLDELGLTDKTIIIISADHGDALGEDGRSVQHTGFSQPADEILRVPLIVAGGGLPAGRRVSALTMNVDIAPTLVDLLGLKTTARFDGASLVDLAREEGRQEDAGRTVLSIARWRYLGGHHRFAYVVRDADYKYQWDPVTNEEALWRSPDMGGERVDVLQDEPDIRDMLRARLESQYVPLLRTWQNLSLRAPVAPFDITLPPTAHPRYNWFDCLGSKYLEITDLPAGKDDSPVRFDVFVPDGVYKVSVYLAEDSAVLAKAQDDREFVTVSNDNPNPNLALTVVDIGEYTVRDQSFTIAFEKASADRPATIGKLVFTPKDVGTPSLTPEDEETIRERLNALGYTG